MKAVLKKYAKRYFIDAMGAMALGLFASLLIGTIFNALGMIPGLSVLSNIGKGAQGVAGPAMAVAIAFSLMNASNSSGCRISVMLTSPVPIAVTTPPYLCFEKNFRSL